MVDNRKIKNDKYPGITHPAVDAVVCRTCYAAKGTPCRKFGRRSGPYCRTHARRITAWKIANNL